MRNGKLTHRFCNFKIDERRLTTSISFLHNEVVKPQVTRRRTFCELSSFVHWHLGELFHVSYKYNCKITVREVHTWIYIRVKRCKGNCLFVSVWSFQPSYLTLPSLILVQRNISVAGPHFYRAIYKHSPMYEKFRRDGNIQTTSDSELRHITSLCQTTMVLAENEKVDE